MKAMKTTSLATIVFALSLGVAGAASDTVLESIDRRAEDYWRAAKVIWEHAEPGYQETESSALLAGMLESEGFEVQREVAGIPTAFTATFGTGSPVIGILGEFDALPGLSQQAVPERSAAPGRSYGHGCGHHLFGVASAAAAIAVAGEIREGRLSGTVRYYGTPAEEGGSGKVYMVRAGLFDDVDAVLHWHPSSSNGGGASSNLARVAAKFRFHGTSAHAAAAPEQGRSALDAVELTNHAAQLLREHTPDFTRIHHVVTAGGGAPNVVPNFAEVYYYVRHPDPAVVRDIYDRLVLCAEAGALATQTRLEIDYQGGIHNLLPNKVLSDVALRHLRALNDLEYDAAEREFAAEIQKTLSAPKPLESIREVEVLDGKVRPGSTDVGDVSWVVPTAGVRVTTWVPGTPAHSWQAVACGGTTIGRKGMLLAAKTLAATAEELYRNRQLLTEARREFEERLEGKTYQPMLQPGQEPPLDYRNRPSAGDGGN